MTASPAQVDANRTNAMRHGIFSRGVVLQGEDPREYDQLLMDLVSELKPVGRLETSLVERVALSLWRQQRLVRAETAGLELHRQPRDIAKAVSVAMGIAPYHDDAKTAEDLQSSDEEQLRWRQSVIEEIEPADLVKKSTKLDELKATAPLSYAQLLEDVEEGEYASVSAYLKDAGGTVGYFQDLLAWCRRQLKVAELRPEVLAIAELVRDRRAMLPCEQREKLAKYQIQLDNDLYKPLKALREAQEWLLKSIESVSEAAGFVLETRPLANCEWQLWLRNISTCIGR